VKRISFVLKSDPTRRKMPPEELRMHLREISRGCGAHGVVSRRTERRKNKQNLKNFQGDE
jgi:hypothetical protein